MSSIAINSNTLVQNIQQNQAPAQDKPTIQVTDKIVELSKDQVENSGIKRGVVPTLKAAGLGFAGLGVGSLAVVTAQAFIKGGGAGGEMMMGAVGAGAMGAIAGGITAGVVANITGDKLKGSLIGAGGLTATALIFRGGEFLADPKGSIGTILVVAAVGAASGFIGASMAKPKH